MSHSIVCGAAGFVMLALTATSADAQTIKRETARRVPSLQGADTYKAYCAACHGPDGKGNGPAATALKKAPADLTTIAKRNGRTFPTTDVESVIMGQQVLASHGSRDMPIWGPVFQALTTDSSFMKLQVSNLVGYLRSIQTN